MQCDDCSFRFTNPRPEVDQLGRYYESQDYISHSNTRKGIFSFVYQSIRRLTIRSKFRMVSALSNGKSLLDIGCATGELLSYFARNGWQVTGIEPNQKARNFAREVYKLKVEDELFLTSTPEKSFDVITMWHVLEHVPDLNKRFEEINRLLKQDGLLIIAVPNHESRDAVHYGKYWAGYDVPRHLHHFTKKTMKALFEKHGLICIKMIPMKFDSFYVSLLSEKYIHGKNRWMAAVWSGIKSNWHGKWKNNYSSMIFVAKREKT